MMRWQLDAAKPQERDFTTSGAWAEDYRLADAQGPVGSFLATMATAAFGLLLLCGAFTAVKRVLTFLLPLILPGSWQAM